MASNQRFVLQSEEIELLIEARMKSYEQVLRGLKGLFVSSSFVKREEFTRYHDALQMQDHYPGALGLAFAPKVDASNEAHYYAIAQQEGIEAFSIWPEGARDVYAPVFYVDPLGENSRRIVGYDMYSQSVRREALDRAWRTGEASLSGKITLAPTVFEDVIISTLLFLPVYVHELEGAAADDNQLYGWVIAPFDMSALLAQVVLESLEGVDVFVYDGDSTSPESLLYSSTPLNERKKAPAFSRRMVVDIAGRQWTIVNNSNDSFAVASGEEPMRVLVIGTSLSFLFAALVWLLAASRNQALREAARMTKEISETEFRWKSALAGAGDGVWDWDNKKNEISYSQRWLAILGYKEDDYPPTLQDWSKIVHPDDLARVKADTDACTQGRATTLNHEVRLKTASGEYKWVLSRGAVVRWDDDGRALRTIGTIADIEKQKRVELALVESDRRFRGAFETAAIGMALVDLEGNWLQVNKALADMLGYAPNDLLQKTFKDITHPADLHADETQVRQLLDADIDHFHMEKRYFRSDGELIYVLLSVSLVRDLRDEPIHFVYQIEDITERRQLQNLVEHQATHDDLTGLPNRRLLYDRFIHNLAQSRRHKRLMGVMFVDIDHFKSINDTHGHDIGDDVLVEVASRLRSCIRVSDTLARQGGDEFVVLMSELNKPEESERLAKAMLSALEQPLHINNIEIPITLSIGVAIFSPDSGDSHEALLRKADEALYKVKRSGRNGFHIS